MQHVAYVNLVDARTFNDRQTIRVSPPGGDQHVAGMAFSPDSQALFVGLEHTMLKFDIDTRLRRSFPEGALN
jgi:secreted PhoX family phosphatase